MEKRRKDLRKNYFGVVGEARCSWKDSRSEKKKKGILDESLKDNLNWIDCQVSDTFNPLD